METYFVVWCCCYRKNWCHSIKLLVTNCFIKLQYSKIKQAGTEKDFERIVVIDPSTSDLTKKDIFRGMLSDYDYKAEDLLVVGYDLNSSIKAVKELSIETVLY